MADDVRMLADIIRETPRHIYTREGQHVFNTIHKHYPHITIDLASSDVDCYHNDGNIAVFSISVAGMIDFNNQNLSKKEATWY